MGSDVRKAELKRSSYRLKEKCAWVDDFELPSSGVRIGIKTNRPTRNRFFVFVWSDLMPAHRSTGRLSMVMELHVIFGRGNNYGERTILCAMGERLELTDEDVKAIKAVVERD